MKVKLWHVFLVGAIVAAGVGVVYVRHVEQARQEAARLEAEQAAQAQKDREQRAAFEDFLNGFLRGVEESAREYRQRRQVLAGLVRPENLRSPEYVSENASLAESTVLALHIQMDEIMGAFETADGDIAALAAGLSGDGRAAVEQKWQDVRAQQQEKFLAYFASERDVLAAYKALMDFYAARKDGFSVDAESGQVRFTAPEDQAEAATLQSRIDVLSAAQAELLQSLSP